MQFCLHFIKDVNYGQKQFQTRRYSKEFYEKNIADTDYILLITARNSEFKGIAEKCLLDNNIRYDRIIYDTPRGERILINDRKPWDGGIDTAYSFNIDRNNFDL